jgi:uncharacterized protein (DUF362 family)
MAVVAISHGTNVIDLLEDSLEKLGGISQFIQEGNSVFIKPDLMVPLGPPSTVQPLVLSHVVRLCRQAGAKEVYIGCNPFDEISSKQLFKLLGLDYYLEKVGGKILILEEEPYSEVKISNPIYFDTLFLPEKLKNSDVFISVVAPRTEVFGEYALGINNYLGLLNDKQKHQLIQAGSVNGLLDFFKSHPPQLTIWDAMTVGEGEGPFNQRAVPYNLILASSDLLAGDAIMAQLMGLKPQEVGLLKLASERQLGSIIPHEISIQGIELTEHCKNIRSPLLSSKNISEWFDIIEGPLCPGCQICLRYFLDFLLRFIAKDLKDFGGFTCFIGKIPPDLTAHLKTGVILFGNCARSSNIPIPFVNKIQKKKFFFEFSGCPPLNLRLLEKFCLDFKEWLPSLEFIEEFIRKWTGGRQFKSYQVSSEMKSQEFIHNDK